MIKYFISVEWLGIVFRDPVTAITNLLIVFTSFWCYRQFRKVAADDVPTQTWRWFFYLMGISSFIAVIVHGFSYYTPENIHLGIWITMCLTQGFAITFAQRATIQQYIAEPARKYWLAVPVVQFVAFATLLTVFKSYEVTKAHVAAGLVPIMVWGAILSFSGNTSGRMIALGILVASVTAVIHGLKISFGNWFNYNDISHLFICASLWLMCKGILRGAAVPVTVRA